MTRPSTTTQAERLAAGTVLGAEGYVFELERRGYIKAGPFVPEVILDAPDALRELHRELLAAGADVMVALTYYAHRDKLRDVGRGDDLEAMNRQAVRIANEIAAEGGALVAGNICNTWSYDPADAERTGAAVRAQYREQLGWAAEEGVDFVIAETNDYLGEALIGLEVCQELSLPAMVTFASIRDAGTYDGYSYVDACRAAADHGAAIVGLNCSRGPETMLPLLARIREGVDVPVAAQPVPFATSAATPAFESLADAEGRRLFPIQLERFALTRFEMADFARRAVDLGVNYVGICCGGGPHHVRAMAEAIGRRPPASRYSPAMDLHPVMGSTPAHDDMGDWSAAGSSGGSSGGRLEG
ncbi:MAG TPA: homocysteine S-methyltransferase family protein [Acidimicrobiales bacterium]|nr:homocysteine S-methyltransferase family protein [Acidimicrobiales bacterium]